MKKNEKVMENWEYLIVPVFIIVIFTICFLIEKSA